MKIDVDQLSKRFEALNEAADIALAEDEDRPVIDQAHFELKVLGESETWRVVVVYYEENVSNSWGVLLVEDKRSHTWRSIYDVPHEGSSKRYLFLPDVESLQGDALQLAMCTDCSWWGRFASFRIDLNTLGYEQLP